MSLQTVQASFLPGNSLSGPVALPGALVGIGVPATWTTAPLSFRTSQDGGITWVEIYSDTGNNFVLPVAAPSYSLINKNYWGGVTLLMLRSGTVNSPITQAAAVGIALSVKVD